MCGFGGVWSAGPIGEPAQLAARLDAALAHRGPDGHAWSTHDHGRLLFVHRRLAIIEPSSVAAQPMSTPDGRYAIVFNGEIYNHAALRHTLEQKGERFATRSDTEVLLRLAAQRGPQALVEARGMFAFALWDALERTLLVARDRFGIKPLYVAMDEGRVGVASEVRALRTAGFGCDADVAGVLSFLEWGSVPAPLTWRAGVQALEPGTWRKFSAHGVTCGTFADVRKSWTVRGSASRPASDTAFGDEVAAAFDDSLRHHLVADVPVGVFLSAGVDSVAIAARARACSGTLKAFTVGGDDPALDETADAQSIARDLGIEHQVVRIDAVAAAASAPRG
jgi:asparagine synthase (glutamine-hydrolysing)